MSTHPLEFSLNHQVPQHRAVTLCFPLLATDDLWSLDRSKRNSSVTFAQCFHCFVSTSDLSHQPFTFFFGFFRTFYFLPPTNILCFFSRLYLCDFFSISFIFRALFSSQFLALFCLFSRPFYFSSIFVALSDYYPSADAFFCSTL